MCVRLMETIQSIPQPVIAEVAGIATAAGCQLVATCDLAVASSAAKFATPGVKIGLFCTTPMVALTRAIGRKRAMEMLLTGEIDRRARPPPSGDWSTASSPPDELEAATRALAEQIASAARLRRRSGQGGVLRADRPRPAEGVRVRQRGHVDERPRRRRSRRDGRVRRQARAGVADVMRLTTHPAEAVTES